MRAEPTQKKYCFGKHYFWNSQKCMRKKTGVSVFPAQTCNRRLIEEIKVEFTFTITAPRNI